jgi:hypothetical protein
MSGVVRSVAADPVHVRSAARLARQTQSDDGSKLGATAARGRRKPAGDSRQVHVWLAAPAVQ